jgi:hypothetical protein
MGIGADFEGILKQKSGTIGLGMLFFHAIKRIFPPDFIQVAGEN